MAITRRRLLQSGTLAAVAPALLATTGLPLSPAVAQTASGEPAWRHALSLFGDIKYPADFKRFDYVNPDAPKGGTWTDEDLNQFISNPKGFVPGTAMGLAGIQKDSERSDVIAYLHTLADNPVPLPTAAK